MYITFVRSSVGSGVEESVTQSMIKKNTLRRGQGGGIAILFLIYKYIILGPSVAALFRALSLLLFVVVVGRRGRAAVDVARILLVVLIRVVFAFCRRARCPRRLLAGLVVHAVERILALLNRRGVKSRA